MEACLSWFSRFRKLLVRHEKLERTFVALNHITAAMDSPWVVGARPSDEAARRPVRQSSPNACVLRSGAT